MATKVSIGWLILRFLTLHKNHCPNALPAARGNIGSFVDVSHARRVSRTPMWFAASADGQPNCLISFADLKHTSFRE